MKAHHPEINEPAEGYQMVTVKEMTVGTCYALELQNGEVEEVYIESIKVHDHNDSVRNIIFSRYDENMQWVKRFIVRADSSPAFILENN